MRGEGHAFDPSTANNEIDFREVVCCLSELARGSTEERLRLLFDIFDADDSGFLEGEEIAALAGAVMKGAPEGQAEAFRRKVRRGRVFSTVTRTYTRGTPFIAKIAEALVHHLHTTPVFVTTHQGRTNHGR